MSDSNSKSKSRFLLSSYDYKPIDASLANFLPVRLVIKHRYSDLMPTIDLSTTEVWDQIQVHRLDNPFGLGQSVREVLFVHAREQYYVDVVVIDIQPTPVAQFEQTTEIPAWLAFVRLFSRHPLPPFSDESDLSQTPFGT